MHWRTFSIFMENWRIVSAYPNKCSLNSLTLTQSHTHTHSNLSVSEWEHKLTEAKAMGSLFTLAKRYVKFRDVWDMLEKKWCQSLFFRKCGVPKKKMNHWLCCELLRFYDENSSFRSKTFNPITRNPHTCFLKSSSSHKWRTENTMSNSHKKNVLVAHNRRKKQSVQIGVQVVGNNELRSYK